MFDSYADTGAQVAVDLVNDLVVDPAADPMTVLRRVLAVDPPSLSALRRADVGGFVHLAERLQPAFGPDVDATAARLNELLAEHPAHPHLAKEDGVWRLHHHPVEAALVPMWTAICAEALARLVGDGQAHRLGTCPDCGKVFLDVSKNASRRFCSLTCQNRVKAAAHRARQRTR
jgi:predicted RNA-binding Zn ribbon-like protein